MSRQQQSAIGSFVKRKFSADCQLLLLTKQSPLASVYGFN